jgi:hypothetical protein
MKMKKKKRKKKKKKKKKKKISVKMTCHLHKMAVICSSSFSSNLLKEFIGLQPQITFERTIIKKKNINEIHK